MHALAEALAYVSFLPPWASHLVVVLAMTWTVCCAGVVMAKLGKGPAWAVLLFLPYAALVWLWWLAYADWPRQREGHGRDA